MRNWYDPLIVVLFVVVLIGFLSGVSLYTTLANTPTDLKPGDEVAVLTGKTVVNNGQPCQNFNHGFVSPTAPDGGLIWWKPERVFWPVQRSISVVSDKSTVYWALRDHIIKLPADSYRLLCPATVQP